MVRREFKSVVSSRSALAQSLQGQPVSGSIINPGGRRTGMVGDRLRDLDGATRIHVFGDVRRTETVTTQTRFSIPLAFSFSTSRAWIVEWLESFQSFRDSCRRKEKVKHSDLTPGTSMQRPTASLAFQCADTFFFARHVSKGVYEPIESVPWL